MEKEIEDVKKLMEDKKYNEALNKLYDMKNKYNSNEMKKYEEYIKFSKKTYIILFNPHHLIHHLYLKDIP